jgi:hypothetical protein
MKLRHFIDTQDFTKQELLDMIQLTRMIKEADRQGCTPKLLQDASLAMIFEEPSTRTRVSFEVAMTETAALSHYVLPTRSGYESWDGTFFAWTFPEVYFQMRRPILEPEGDVRRPWKQREIDRLPTSHRLRLADIDGTGKKVVINAPLTAASAGAPDYRGRTPLAQRAPRTSNRRWPSRRCEWRS